MFGFRYIKFDPTQHVMRYRSGKLVEEGAGLAFWYFRHNTSLVSVPLQTTDAPFMFEETTADFQEVSVQGQVTYRIKEPANAAKLLNFTLSPQGHHYASEDPDKLQQRVINTLQVLTSAKIAKLELRDVLRSGTSLGADVASELAVHQAITSLGLEVCGLTILAIKPNPDTMRALEAEAREQLLKEADDAIYLRRNASVEQERAIKENELRTEQAVQEKQNQIATTQTEHDIAIEERRKEFVVQSAENTKIESEARAHSVQSVIQALSNSDPKIVQALAGVGMDPDRLMAAALHELAGNAEKIGEVNLAPEMFQELVRASRRKQPKSD